MTELRRLAFFKSNPSNLFKVWHVIPRNLWNRIAGRKHVSGGQALIAGLRTRLASLKGQNFAGQVVASADEFSYHDPVDGSISEQQGVRITFEGGTRAVFRLSGTGTEGATLRLYLEQYSGADGAIDLDTQTALEPVRDAALEICAMEEMIGRTAPDVVT